MVVAVLRSRLVEESSAASQQVAHRMLTLAEGMPGFISCKVLVADDGER